MKGGFSLMTMFITGLVAMTASAARMNGVGVRFKNTPHPHSVGCFMPPWATGMAGACIPIL